MARRSHAWLGMAALVALSACDGAGSGPLSPTPLPAAAPPAPPVNGTIEITSTAPASGATVTVVDCDPTLSLGGGVRPMHPIGLCNQGVVLTFSVAVDRALPDAYLTVDFRDGDERCAFSSGGRRPLAAGERVAWPAELVVLSDDPNIPQACPLPTTTTRIIVELRNGLGGPPLLSREFSHIYTFTLG